MKKAEKICWLTVACALWLACDLYAFDKDTSALQSALQNGRLEDAVQYVNQAADEAERKGRASKALGISAGLGHTAHCKRFLALGADPHFRAGKFDLAIIRAIKGNHYETAAFLAENGTDLYGYKSDIGKAAAGAGMIDFVKSHLSKVKWFGEHDKNIMLKSAILGGQGGMVRYLLSQGANPYEKLRDRFRIFCFAFHSKPGPEKGREDVIKALLDHKVDIDRPDFDGWTPIASAVAAGDDEMANRLLAAGANPVFHLEKIKSMNPRTKHRMKALHARHHMQLSAEQYGRMLDLAGTGGNIAALIEAGNPPPAIRENRLSDALNAAIAQGHVGMVRQLLAMGASTTKAGYEKLAPLYVALEAKNPRIIKVLIENHAEINIGDKDHNPFITAIRGGSPEVLVALLEYGKPDLSKYGNLALETAIFHKDESMVAALLKAGADPDSPKTLLPVVKYIPGYSESPELKSIEDMLKSAGASQLSKEEKEKQRQVIRVGAIPTLSILAVLGLFLGQAGLRAVLAAAATQKWQETKGEITASRVILQYKKYRGFRLRHYYIPIIKYSYWINKRKYNGNVVYVGYWKSSLESWAERTAAKYPEGAKVPVYFDPDNPKYAVLEHGKTHPVNLALTLFFFIGALSAMALVGLLGFY